MKYKITKIFHKSEKVALANGLRRLFPNEIAELPYTQEEDYITKDYVEQKPKAISKQAQAKVEELENKEINIEKVMGK